MSFLFFTLKALTVIWHLCSLRIDCWKKQSKTVLYRENQNGADRKTFQVTILINYKQAGKVLHTNTVFTRCNHHFRIIFFNITWSLLSIELFWCRLNNTSAWKQIFFFNCDFDFAQCFFSILHTSILSVTSFLRFHHSILNAWNTVKRWSLKVP